ncbi:MAG TPA: acyloxyacyl hydrolase [Stellaceae bacterium]
MRHAHIGRPALALALVCSIGAGAAAAQTRGAPLDLGPAQLAGDEASYLDLAAGTFGTRPGHVAPDAASGRVELRYGRKLFHLGPTLGVLGNTKGGVFGYADVVITPLAGAGGYHHGRGEDLGGTFEFCLGLGAAYELAGGSRLGLQYGHISNAGSHRINPGENELLVTYGLPLGF